ncbi:MAG: MerR family transcriptional regulator [Erysipelotrichaceae bacterium]|nr:MerR family transcriptional regulator [Erysipelotrichaceae bacterium]
MKISEVSQKYNLTTDTLRYYEKIGLLKDVPRSKGIRDYDDKSCQRIEFIKCMREAGVEIQLLKQYFDLYDLGPSTVSARKALLQQQRERLLEKQRNIQQTLERLNYKIEMCEEEENHGKI